MTSGRSAPTARRPSEGPSRSVGFSRWPQPRSTRSRSNGRLHRRTPLQVRGPADLPGVHRARLQDRPEHVLGGQEVTTISPSSARRGNCAVRSCASGVRTSRSMGPTRSGTSSTEGAFAWHVAPSNGEFIRKGWVEIDTFRYHHPKQTRIRTVFVMAGGVTVDLGELLKAIPETLKGLIEIVQLPWQARTKRRLKVYTDFVLPLDRAMDDVYKDYQKHFQLLVELIDEKSELSDIIQILEADRLVQNQTRTEVKARAAALKESQPAHLRQPEVKAFVSYTESINRFFLGHGGNPVEARYSWYSDFIDGFKMRVGNDQDPFGYYEEITSTEPPAIAARNALANAVQKELPSAWQQYFTEREKLRKQLT
jgi:hypothetical protein